MLTVVVAVRERGDCLAVFQSINDRIGDHRDEERLRFKPVELLRNRTLLMAMGHPAQPCVPMNGEANRGALCSDRPAPSERQRSEP